MTSAIHGGAHWQPRIRAAGDYDGIVAADVNDAWYPPAPAVLETIAQWASRANHSPDTSCQSLREALARHFPAPFDTLRIGAGSSDLLHHIVQALARPGDQVLTLSPTYTEYARVAGLAGADVRVLGLDPGNHFSASAEALLEAVRPQTKLIALCNPNNPTGRVLTRSALLQVVSNLPSEVYVMVDEAYIDFAPSESVFGDVAGFENLAVVRTFSKAFAMAGLRVGYAALGERVRAQFDRVGRPPWPVGLLGLRGAEVALEHRDYVEQRVAECARLKEALIAELGAPTIPSATHYFLADLEGTGVAAAELLLRLRERGVFLRDFSTFGGSFPERFVRITTQSPGGNLRIVDALRHILLDTQQLR